MNKQRKIQLALVFLLIFGSISSVYAGRISPLAVAQSQIGLGEVGANNSGKYVKMYLRGQEKLPWCAGFVSYCFREAGIKIQYTLRAKDFLKLGIKVNSPKAGDVIVFSRRGGGHVGIIEKIEGNRITTIEGNTGEYPSRVKRIVYNSKPRNMIAYIRINK